MGNFPKNRLEKLPDNTPFTIPGPSGEANEGECRWMALSSCPGRKEANSKAIVSQ